MAYCDVQAGRGWIALAIRLPAWLAARVPAPVACVGAGWSRIARELGAEAARRAAVTLLDGDGCV